MKPVMVMALGLFTAGCSCGTETYDCDAISNELRGSGLVVSPDDAGISGVLLQCFDEMTALATTDSTGGYSFTAKVQPGLSTCPSRCNHVRVKDPSGAFLERKFETLRLAGNGRVLQLERRDGG